MNSPVVTLCLAGILSIALFCRTAAAEDADMPTPQIKTSIKVFRAPPEDVLSKRLYVEFVDSPKLSAMFREALGRRGFNVVAAADAADTQIRFRGNVGIGLFATKLKILPLAEAVEKSEIKPTGKDQVEVGNTSLASTVAMDATAKQLSLSFRNVLTAANLLEWIGDVTGFRAGFNKAITGDPRGFCLSEHCDKYQQQVIVAASGEASWLITLSTLSEEIILDRLVDESLNRALEPLLSK